jgi:phospholipid/cholesterol/gamma-HCH transport system substrate-binding protein
VITRRARIQLIAFVLLTVVGVTYAGFRYAGFGNIVGTTTYPVTMQLADSGGIFTGADVTYRGVSVGRVGALTLTEQGIDVRLDIEKSAPPIPADVDARVGNLSAIGEQHVDLDPKSDGGPVLAADSVIPVSRTSTPVPIQDLVVSLDGFARSMPLDSLRTVVDELGTGFNDTARPLQKILDTTDAFTADAVDALPQTLQLIRDGRTVLTTQNETAGSFKSFSHDLKLLAEQLKSSDPDLRRLIHSAPEASDELVKLLRESGSGISHLVANLLTVSRVAEPRQDGLRQILVTYPGVAANGYTTAWDGNAHFGLVLNLNDPPPCTKGYEGTKHRSGDDVSEIPANEDAYCAEPHGSPTDVRGAQNVPAGGDTTPAASDADAKSDASNPLPALPGLPDIPPLSSPAQILLG